MNEYTARTVRKTYKYKLKPTPEQERAMAFVVYRCRELSNAALEERRDAWHKRGVTITEASQSAQLPAIKDVRPEYREIHSQVLQDALTRLDRAFQAFFRRIREGQTPGYARFQGANRSNSFTYKQFSNGATLDKGFLVLSKIGRIAVRWSRPLEGAPKTVTISREADGWDVCFSCTDVPTQPLPATGQATGIDLGIEAFATLSNGQRIFHPSWYRKAERALKTAQRRVSRRTKGRQARTQRRSGPRTFDLRDSRACRKDRASTPPPWRLEPWSLAIVPSRAFVQGASARAAGVARSLPLHTVRPPPRMRLTAHFGHL
jgi:putative transposase